MIYWILGYLLIAVLLFAVLRWAIGSSNAVMAAACALWPLSFVAGWGIIAWSVIAGMAGGEQEEKAANPCMAIQFSHSVCPYENPEAIDHGGSYRHSNVCPNAGTVECPKRRR